MSRADPVAVVTGAGSGIGRAVSRALLARGYRVALAGRHAADTERVTCRRRTRSRTRALVLVTDVRDPASVTRLFGRVRDQWGRVDLLFNNAGDIRHPGTI